MTKCQLQACIRFNHFLNILLIKVHWYWFVLNSKKLAILWTKPQFNLITQSYCQIALNRLFFSSYFTIFKYAIKTINKNKQNSQCLIKLYSSYNEKSWLKNIKNLRRQIFTANCFYCAILCGAILHIVGIQDDFYNILNTFFLCIFMFQFSKDFINSRYI